MPARPSRRSVVAAALAVPVASAAGCTLSDPAPPRRPQASAEADPDVVLLDEASSATDEMVSLYEAVADRHQELRQDLRPFLQAHQEHADALGDAAPPENARRGGGRPGGADVTAPPADVDVPARRAAALRRLTQAERDHAERLLDATRRAASGDFARLLASMSAASTVAAQLLAEAGRR
jgi:type IV pilus biogenesis protein CpaD/CtpE